MSHKADVIYDILSELQCEPDAEMIKYVFDRLSEQKLAIVAYDDLNHVLNKVISGD